MRTPRGYVARRGDEHNHPNGAWPHTDDCDDRWYIDTIGQPVDHRGKGYRTRAEAVEVLSDRLDFLRWPR